METKYTIAWEPSGFIVEFNGTVGVEDILGAGNEIYADDRFNTMIYSIWDFTNAELSKVEKEDMMIFVGEDLGATYMLKDHKLAIIVEEPHALNIMSYYIEKSIINGSSWKFSTHESVLSARSWIST